MLATSVVNSRLLGIVVPLRLLPRAGRLVQQIPWPLRQLLKLLDRILLVRLLAHPMACLAQARTTMGSLWRNFLLSMLILRRVRSELETFARNDAFSP